MTPNDASCYLGDMREILIAIMAYAMVMAGQRLDAQEGIDSPEEIRVAVLLLKIQYIIADPPKWDDLTNEIRLPLLKIKVLDAIIQVLEGTQSKGAEGFLKLIMGRWVKGHDYLAPHFDFLFPFERLFSDHSSSGLPLRVAEGQFGTLNRFIAETLLVTSAHFGFWHPVEAFIAAQTDPHPTRDFAEGLLRERRTLEASRVLAHVLGREGSIDPSESHLRTLVERIQDPKASFESRSAAHSEYLAIRMLKVVKIGK